MLAVFENGFLVRVKRWYENGNAQLTCSLSRGKVSDFKRLFEYKEARFYLDPEFLAQGKDMELYQPWFRKAHNLDRSLIEETRHPSLLFLLNSWATKSAKDGTLMMWHSNGKEMLSVECLLGVPNGLWANWNKSGWKIREINVKNGQLDGKLVVYHKGSNVRKEVEHYSEGKPTGSWTKRLPNKQVIERYNYLNGVRHGVFNEYHENGARATKGSYLEGQLHGAFLEFTKLGRMKRSILYDKGKKIGIARSWYSTGGRQNNLSRNEKGRLDGRWQAWHENGQIKTRREYREGLLLSAKTWCEEGIEMEEQVRDGNGILMEILPDGSRVRHPYENGIETLN